MNMFRRVIVYKLGLSQPIFESPGHVLSTMYDLDLVFEGLKSSVKVASGLNRVIDDDCNLILAHVRLFCLLLGIKYEKLILPIALALFDYNSFLHGIPS